MLAHSTLDEYIDLGVDAKFWFMFFCFSRLIMYKIWLEKTKKAWFLVINYVMKHKSLVRRSLLIIKIFVFKIS